MKRSQILLSDAATWIAFGNFDGPDENPYAGYVLASDGLEGAEEFEALEYQNSRHLDRAEIELHEALCAGEVAASGRFSNQPRSQLSSDWRQQVWTEHCSTPTDIPAHFWLVTNINWRDSCVKNRGGEYIDILIDWDALRARWPTPLPLSPSEEKLARGEIGNLISSPQHEAMEIPWESNSGTSEPSRSQKGHGRRVGAPVKAKYEDIYQEIDDVLQEHYENV